VTILVDMNLSPEWVSFFERESWNAVHWSVVGSMSAPDRDILERPHLAVPSSSLTTWTSELFWHSNQLVVTALKQLKEDLERGALVTIDATRIRARILPLR
jgi:predicted nuclease of predicted toxin-antitoxin system